MGSTFLSMVMASVLTTGVCTDCRPVRGLVVAPVRVAVRVAAVPVRVAAVPVRVAVRVAAVPVRVAGRTVRVAARVATAPLRIVARRQPIRRLVRRVVRGRPVSSLLFGRRGCCY